MNKDWIEIMKNKKTLKLSKGNLFVHYGFVLGILIIPLFSIWRLMEFYVLNTYDGVRKPEFTIFEYTCLFITILLFFIQSRRLRFKEVGILTDKNNFKVAFEKTAKELGWQIDFYSNNFVRAYRNSNWTGSWGKMITIIREKDHLLINSICDPNSMSSVFSWGWNRRNVKTFLKNLKKANGGLKNNVADL